jgi:hypothetical protein
MGKEKESGLFTVYQPGGSAQTASRNGEDSKPGVRDFFPSSAQISPALPRPTREIRAAALTLCTASFTGVLYHLA